MPNRQARTMTSREMRRFAVVTLCGVSLGASLIGCSELTSVNSLDVVDLSDLQNRSGAQAMRAGAIWAFANAYAGDAGGSIHSQAVLSALISDEYIATVASTNTYDERRIPDLFPFPTVSNGFMNLSGARVNLLQALEAMREFDSRARDNIAELFGLLGYVTLLLAENYCSGLVLSEITNGEPAYGFQVTTTQVLEHALTAFDSAQTYAEPQSQHSSLLQVGRGRALLHLGRHVEAAASVRDVPTDFEYQIAFASNQENGFWRAPSSKSVANREGGNGLDFVTAGDPRVRTRLIGMGLDGLTPVYGLEKYSSRDSPVVLANGIEARLIQAEMSLREDDLDGTVTTLNALRSRMEGLGPLSVESTEAARVDQLFRERAFWLFATGHRHGDLRRLIRQYGREPETVFPTGVYHRAGLTYGSDVTLDLHVLEQNNPNFAGCFDRNP